MEDIYILYKCDSWLSRDSAEVVFVGSSVDKCCRAARHLGATDGQISQLRDTGQSLCTENRDFEFCIEVWKVNEFQA